MRFSGVVYVLHAFQKKAKRVVQKPKADIDLIKSRLSDAEQLYKAQFKEGGRKP